MTFFTIVLRSLTRRPVRTALTLVGISIGIAAVVTLVGMAWGYEKGITKQATKKAIQIHRSCAIKHHLYEVCCEMNLLNNPGKNKQ